MNVPDYYTPPDPPEEEDLEGEFWAEQKWQEKYERGDFDD